MLKKASGQTGVIQYVNLEDLVPAHHMLRRIRRVLRLEVIEEATRDCYSHTTGRPSVDPTVAFRMMLLGYLFNLSENRLCEELPMHAGYLWFCGLDFNANVPDRTTLVKLRKHTWGERVFRQVMGSVVSDCIRAGLVKGTTLVADGTAVDARAAITSLEPIAPVMDLETYMNTQFVDAEEESDTGPPPDGPTHLADGDFRGGRFSNATHRSRTDRDARLYRKGKEGARLRYLVHNLLDYGSSVILETGATHAYGRLERPAALALIDDCRQDHPDLRERFLLLDAGYTAGEFLAQVERRGLRPIVPTHGLRPPGRVVRPRTRVVAWDRLQRVRADQLAYRALTHAFENERPPWLARARVRIERTFAEAKDDHGLRRARGYGLETMNIQALITAITQNLKRLAVHTHPDLGNVQARALFVAHRRVASSLCASLAPIARSLRPALSQRF